MGALSKGVRGHRSPVNTLWFAVLLLALPAVMSPASAETVPSHGASATHAAIPANVTRWRTYISQASARFAVPSDWIEHVIAAESSGQTVWNGAPITSRAGAMGLMQLMPTTWEAMRMQLGLGNNPHDPRDNILAGTAYLRAMYDRFGYPGLFAAYNAGPGRYQAHLATGRILPAETRAYLVKMTGAVMPDMKPKVAREANPMAPKQGLFVALRDGNGASSTAEVGDQHDVLFIVDRRR